MSRHTRLFPKGDPMSLITQIPKAEPFKTVGLKAPIWDPRAVANKRRYDAAEKGDAKPFADRVQDGAKEGWRR